ncbi:NAD(P)H-binding protein [Nonomuraea sp. NPDC050691]|uniref:NAD(P)H-binding protein n=1 Tax=Nonomuraea sp. NPDC050691 TaxID=3155661 RepID=UPI0033E652CD
MDRYEPNDRSPEAGGVCLLTVVSPRKDEGNSPTGIVGRRMARQLLSLGRRVRVIAEPDQCGGWPDMVEVVEGSITRPLECARAFDGAEAVFLAGAHPATVQEALSLARDAATRKIVLLSSHGPEYEEANPAGDLVLAGDREGGGALGHRLDAHPAVGGDGRRHRGHVPGDGIGLARHRPRRRDRP